MSEVVDMVSVSAEEALFGARPHIGTRTVISEPTKSLFIPSQRERIVRSESLNNRTQTVLDLAGNEQDQQHTTKHNTQNTDQSHQEETLHHQPARALSALRRFPLELRNALLHRRVSLPQSPYPCVRLLALDREALAVRGAV